MEQIYQDYQHIIFKISYIFTYYPELGNLR